MSDSYTIEPVQIESIHKGPHTGTYEQYVPMDPKYLYPQKEQPGLYSSLDDIGTVVEFGLEQLMAQQKEILVSKIDMLNTHIYERHKLKDDNLYLIDRDQCVCRNLIYTLGDHLFHPKRIDLEKKILDLEQEKRRERTGFFQDILFLRKELRETEIQRIEQEQKRRFFIDQTEAHSCKV